MRAFSESIRNEQMMGTIEAMLVTSTKISTIILSSALWKFIFNSIAVLIYLLLGVFIFGVNISSANYGAAFIILILTIISFSSFGIMSASFIMVYKRGNPVNFLFNSTSSLLGGVFYPITVMPIWLQTFSHFLPITYSLRAMRHALLQGYSFQALSSDITALVIFCIILLPSSIVVFKYAVKRAKMDGSLTHY
jgi:ABC-2 type transport system permease protein